MPGIEIDLEVLPENKPVRFELEGMGVVVVRIGTEIHAYEDVCPHAGWRLSEGEIIDGRLECPGHGWQFQPATGQCTDVPAYRLKPVTVTRIGDKVTIAIAGSVHETR